MLPDRQNLTKTLYGLIAEVMDLDGLTKVNKINCLYNVGRILLRLRPLLNKQLGRIKRGISPNADTSEYHRVDEHFTNLFCITPHLFSPHLYNETLKRHPLKLTTLPSVVPFLRLHITLGASPFFSA